MSRLKPPLALPLSRLIQASILILSLATAFIPTRTAHADDPPPILPGGWRTFTTVNAPIAPGMVTKIFEDSQERVWISTSGGVSVYKDGVWQTFTEKDGLAAGRVRTVVEDRTGRVWVGTSGGVSVYAGGAWQTFTEKDGLAAGEVYHILEDRAGRVWVRTSQYIASEGKYTSGVSVYVGGAWQTFTEKDGLAASGVSTLVEDRAGRVWVGTTSGVSVYVGGAWQTFMEKDGLAAGGVNTLAEDRAGQVWVGATGGVSVYAGGAWQTFTAEKDGLAQGAVSAIVVDRSGRVWVGAGQYVGGKWVGGVSVYAGGSWQTFTEKDGLAAGEADAILEDRTGRVWVGTDNGVSVYIGGVWRTYGENNDLARGEVSTVMEDRFGRIWIGTGGWPDKGGVSVFTSDVWQTFSMKEGLARGSVHTIMEDRVGQVWVGTGKWPDIGGVSVYVGGAWQTFTERDGLATGGVKAIAEDSVGRVWIGTADYTRGTGGVSIYANGTWQTYTNKDGVAAGPVNAIAKDHVERMWVATDNGVSVYESGIWRTFTENNGFTSGGANVIMVDHTGRVWVGADTWHGVSAYADGVWQTFTRADGLAVGRVETIMEDAVGRIWVGAADYDRGTGGVSMYKPVAWQTLAWQTFHEFGLVNIITQDHIGRVWIGTGSTVPVLTGSVVVYRDGELQQFSEKDGLTIGFVVTILEDKAGRIWVGTADYGRKIGGVSVYTGNTWQAFMERDGLATGPVKTIVEDSVGCVWIGMQGGISVYVDGVWHTFTAKDGLAAGGVQTILEDHTGRVWIGTESGVSVKRRPTEPPWALLEGILAKSRAINYRTNLQSIQDINLPSGSYELQFDFSGSDMDSRQDNVFFRYRLEGREQEWHTTQAHEAQYTNLPPGDYTFVVKSVDEDALESPPATLQIHIERFLWQSPVAWAGGAAGLGLLAFGTVVGTQRWRRKRQLDAWRKGHDPYIVGAVIEEPDKFYGREETLTELIHALEAGNHIVLYGERRIGKTSLLHQLAHRLDQAGTFPVFFEMQGVREDWFFLALMSEIAKTVRECAEVGPLLADNRPERYDNLDMRHDLDTVFDVLKTGGDSVRIVLLLDEADTMNSYDPHIQAALRGLLMRAGKRINLIWSGQHLDRQWRLDTSPWYNLFSDEIRLGGIEQTAAVHLIRQPVKGVFEYDDAAVERILKYSDSKPYQIQRLCSACVRRLLQVRRDRVTVGDVDAAYQALTMEDKRLSSESSAPISYQVSSPAHQVAEKKADYKKDDAE